MRSILLQLRLEELLLVVGDGLLVKYEDLRNVVVVGLEARVNTG
jgi:hypothetical protein